jgi:hypothetical protein
LTFIGCTKPSVGTSDNDGQIRSRISKLLENNIECINNIFFYDTLPCEYDDTSNSTFAKVTSDKFRSFDELKAFINDTYASEEANDLLYNYMGKGNPLYFEKDGEFYEDLQGGGTGIGFLDWRNYTFEYSDIDSSSKLITISLMEYPEEGSNSTLEKATTITVKLVLENGIWKLNRMISD